MLVANRRGVTLWTWGLRDASVTRPPAVVLDHLQHPGLPAVHRPGSLEQVADERMSGLLIEVLVLLRPRRRCPISGSGVG